MIFGRTTTRRLRFLCAAFSGLFSISGVLAADERDILGRKISVDRWGTSVYDQVSELKKKGSLDAAQDLLSKEIVKAGAGAEPGLFFQRAEIAYQQKKFKNAIEDYSIALAKNPLDQVSGVQIAYCWYKLGDYRKAQIDLKIAQKNGITLPAQCLSGLLDAATDKPKQALRQLESVVAPNNVSYLTADQKAEALQVIRQLKEKGGGALRPSSFWR